MLSLTATNARRDFFTLVKSVTEQDKVFHIQHKMGTAVLMSEDFYENLIETLELLSSPELKKSLERSLKQVEKGETFSMEEILGS
ncbi:MAG: type II toxin-antitoxin system Phd/YefM family antitoxin [Gammaproteobacteria bacterium]|nr:type II toxin-antitoxin system Phd/YefM family antitoxin [Gammaproteobacteria bacterium]